MAEFWLEQLCGLASNLIQLGNIVEILSLKTKKVKIDICELLSYCLNKMKIENVGFEGMRIQLSGRVFFQHAQSPPLNPQDHRKKGREGEGRRRWGSDLIYFPFAVIKGPQRGKVQGRKGLFQLTVLGCNDHGGEVTAAGA